MAATWLRMGLAVAAVLIGSCWSWAQDVPRIRVLVELDPNIRGYLRPNEIPQALQDELSAALAASILEGGRWSQFCWDLALKGKTAVGELRVALNKDLAGNWEMAASFSLVKGVVRITEDLPSKLVLTSADLTRYGQPSRVELPQRLARWFSTHYLAPPQREQLHLYLCKNVPVGRGTVAVNPAGTCVLTLPARFEHFRYSVFKFICQSNGQSLGVDVQGIGSVAPAMVGTEPAVQLSLKTQPLPPTVQCNDVTVYLLKFVPESELGGLPVF
jgi:hypothetical protein